MPESIGSMLPSLDQVMVSGAEPRASQTSRVSSHSSTVSSDGGGPVMLDGTEEGGREGGSKTQFAFVDQITIV